MSCRFPRNREQYLLHWLCFLLQRHQSVSFQYTHSSVSLQYGDLWNVKGSIYALVWGLVGVARSFLDWLVRREAEEGAA